MIKEYEKLVKEFESDKKDKDFKELKIAVLSTYTLKNILYPLKYNLLISGYKPIIKFGGYNQFIQELMDESSFLYEFKPDVILIALNSRSYLEDLEFTILDKNKKEINELINEKVSFIKTAILSTRLKSKIILTNLDHFMYSPYGLMDISRDEGIHSAIELFNNGLIEIKKESKSLELLDFEKICSFYGKKNIFDEKMFFLGKILLSSLGAEKISEEFTLFIKAAYGKNKKVLVVDLDNTLWRGVVGEEGALGIGIGEGPVGEIYKEVQKVILNYKKMGVVIAISSKNNETDVSEVFSNNRNMILKSEDFIIKKINWQPKSLNIQSIAKELNLGLDSFVFLDDNPAERLEVKTALPMIEVIDFPKDVALLPAILKEMPYFKSLSLTEEDKKRHEMYSLELKRNELKESYSIEEYLKKLETSITVKIDDFENIERIVQLINKTNQFNLRTKRYTLEQVKSMMESREYSVYSLSVKDKFGELGLTGVIIIKDEGKDYFLDTFLLSCRILSRKIENQFFLESIKSLRNDKLVHAEYIQSDKNEQVKDFYDLLGFNLIEEDGKTKKYSKLLKDLFLTNIDWITVKNG